MLDFPFLVCCSTLNLDTLRLPTLASSRGPAAPRPRTSAIAAEIAQVLIGWVRPGPASWQVNSLVPTVLVWPYMALELPFADDASYPSRGACR